jgi:hypothetical protein
MISARAACELPDGGEQAVAILRRDRNSAEDEAVDAIRERGRTIDVGAALRGRQPLLRDDGMIEIYRRENTIPKRQRRAAARADEDLDRDAKLNRGRRAYWHSFCTRSSAWDSPASEYESVVTLPLIDGALTISFAPFFSESMNCVSCAGFFTQAFVPLAMRS